MKPLPWIQKHTIQNISLLMIKEKEKQGLLSLALSLHATHHPLRSSIQQGVSNISYETILEVSATSDTPETL